MSLTLPTWPTELVKAALYNWRHSEPVSQYPPLLRCPTCASMRTRVVNVCMPALVHQLKFVLSSCGPHPNSANLFSSSDRAHRCSHSRMTFRRSGFHRGVSILLCPRPRLDSRLYQARPFLNVAARCLICIVLPTPPFTAPTAVQRQTNELPI